MEHEIHQFELLDKARKLANFYKDVNLQEFDPDDFPEELKDFKRELEEIGNNASKVPPNQPLEDNYKEIVQVGIPYNLILQLIRAAQAAGNDQHAQVHRLTAILQVVGDSPAVEKELVDGILNAMVLNFAYTHLAAELNMIRLAVRPAEFARPGEDDQKNYEVFGQLPDNDENADYSNLPSEKDFDMRWLLGGDDADSE